MFSPFFYDCEIKILLKLGNYLAFILKLLFSFRREFENSTK